MVLTTLTGMLNSAPGTVSQVRQAATDLGLHENVLRKWVRNVEAHREQAFPGQGRSRPDDAEVARLRRELAKTKAERDILKKAIAYFAKEPR